MPTNNAMPYDNIQSPAIPKQDSPPRPDAVKREKICLPNQLDKGSCTKQAFENEGDGTCSTALPPHEAATQYIQSGHAEPVPKRAEDCLEGPEGDELRRAKLEVRRATEPDAVEEDDREDEKH
jgi:hypothetical protein